MCGDAPNVECFHHPWAPQGLVQAGDADGVAWESVLPGTSFAGIMYGNGRVMAAGGTPSISLSQGAAGSWVNGGSLNVGIVTRHGAFFSAGAGRFMLMLDGLVKISDNGASWVTTQTPSGCADSALSILAHDSTAVMLKYGGQACVTRDRGNTWSMVTIGSDVTSSGVYAQGAFYT